MNLPKKISVIIPVHNRHNLFEACLNSVVNQKVPWLRVEIIVVDEASDPSIKEYLKSNNRLKKIRNIKVIRNSRALGPSLARTMGFNKSTGDYVAFLDSDDVWEPNFFSIMLSRIDTKKSEMVTSLVKTLFIGEVALFNRLYFSLINFIRNVVMLAVSGLNRGKLPDELFYLMRLSSTVFTRKSIGKARFVMSYRTGEDWKFFWDCIRMNKPMIKIVNRSLVNAAYHNQSETFRRSGYWHYYYKLVDELPLKLRQSKGVKFLKAYTDFSVWKNSL